MAARLTLLTVALATTAWAGGVAAPKLSDAEKKQVEASGILVRERTPTDNRGVSAEAIGVVDAPPDEVWPVVRDCEHFSKFLPSTKASSKKVEQGAWVCFDEISLPFPLTNLWADTRSISDETPGGPYHRTWTLVRGTYRRNQGSWSVLPWGSEGKQSLVVYLIDSDPSMAVPDFLLKSAQTGSMPEVIAAVRKRVLALRSRAATP